MSVTATATIATVSLTSRDLYAALAGFDRLLIRGRQVHPAVLVGVLIESTGTELAMSTFDYGTHARYTVAVDGPVFRTLVDARALLKAVRGHARKATDVSSLEVNEFGSLIVRQGAASTTLNALSLEDMPARPVVPAPYRVVDGAAFDGALARVAMAAGDDDTLPMLTAVHVHHQANSITLASTDRFRLAVDTLATSVLAGDVQDDVLWSARSAVRAVKTFGARHGAVSLHIDGTGPYTTYAGWSCGAWTIMARAIDAEFPRFKSLIPADVDQVFRFDRVSLLAVAAAAVTAKTLKMVFAVDGDQVAIEYGDFDDAVSTSRLAVERATGAGEFRFALNPAYVVDMLKTLGDDQVDMSANSPTKPFVFRVDSLTDYVALLMPVRLPA